MYLQDDRDLRGERTRKKLEKAFAFMLRVRISGGVLTTKQWRALDWIARVYGNGTMRATTRQTIQLHGVIKSNLKATLKAIDEQLLNTIAACGDVNRNVMSNPEPVSVEGACGRARAGARHFGSPDAAHRRLSRDLARRREDRGRRAGGGRADLRQDLSAAQVQDRGRGAALERRRRLRARSRLHRDPRRRPATSTGWNVTVGGGMGMTHGEPDTYPRTADVMGFCETRDAIAVAEAVVTVQRDWGDRTNRKHARLKYTIEDRGLDAFRAEVEKRAGMKLGAPKPFAFTSTGDRYGWTEGENGKAHLTLYIANGRIQDIAGGAAHAHRPAQDRRDPQGRHAADREPERHHRQCLGGDARRRSRRSSTQYRLVQPISGLRRNSMACVALPTCGLALAESERYLPDLIDALDQRLAAYGLAEDDIVIRMTGCPNGCARPYLAEIGLVGKGPGRYNLYLGAAFDGSRLSKLYAEDLQHDGIVAALDPLFAAYAKEREPDERFGDFVIRAGFVAKTGNGARLPRRTPERSAPHERSRPPPASAPPAPIAGSGAACSRRRTDAAARRSRAIREHPANFGRLCSKGAALGETLGLDDAAAASDAAPARRHARARRLGHGARHASRTASSASSSATDRTRSRSISRASCSPRTITSPTS